MIQINCTKEEDCDDNKPNKTTDCSVIETPCEKANRILKNNANFISELNRLKGRANLRVESGSINMGSNTPKSIVGTTLGENGENSIDLLKLINNNPNISDQLNGFGHTHPSFAESIFSLSDIAILGCMPPSIYILIFCKN